MKRSKNSPFLKEPAISDGKSSMRVFEFNTNVRRRLANFEKTREHVILEGCEIKHSRVNKDLEIMVTSHTTLTKLWYRFNLDIVLRELHDLNCFEKVSLQAKLVEVDDIIKVKGDKQKQDAIIRDNTGSTKLTVWEKNVGILKNF